ncbi:isochorismate synthase MenF [Nonomuraea typhae]|uniref:isochorismate synthase n=1 Tax=Nonomuraea typhae TaxID=2603600 RepID=A0ABW7Z5J0_9ACTN
MHAGFEEVCAKAAAEARNAGRPVLALWREEIERVEPLLPPSPSRSTFFWAGSGLTLLGLDRAATFVAEGSNRFNDVRRAWERTVQDMLTAGPGDRDTPALVGAFSFGDGPGSLMWVPRVLVAQRPEGAATLCLAARADPVHGVEDDAARTAWRAAGWLAAGAVSPCPPLPVTGHVAEELPSPREWKELVARAVALIGEGRFSKVVLARRLRVRLPYPPDLGGLLHTLIGAQPGTTVFAAGTGTRTFAGATPERLVAVRGGRAETMSLAATLPRGGTGGADARLRDELIGDGKSRREQAIVTEALRGALEQVCHEVDVPGTPEVLDLPNVRHLCSRVSGRLADPETTGVLDLAGLLHPTPAVGGHPRPEALGWLREAEAFDRGWYAGPIGWVNARQEGDFAVALRSALLDGDSATLFAGCGIVAGSDPERELAETWLKFRPMLSALLNDQGDLR